MTGRGEFGYDYSSYDIDGTTNDIDGSTYHGAGSALWMFKDNLNVQGGFGFGSSRLETDGGEELTADFWSVGAGAFHRDPEMLLGGELRYQSLDILGEYVDGFSLTGRGEKYLANATLGAHIGWSSLDRSELQVDGWQIGAYGTYYDDSSLGLRLGADLGRYEGEINGDNFDIDDWSINGEAEYLIPDCATSLFAGLGYGESGVFSDDDLSSWRIGGGIRLHFGTDGSLMQRHRAEPLYDLRSMGLRF
jgi:Autotransporter beta-domain